MSLIVRVVSILAVAHVLALLGLIGYLAGTGRLSRERADAVRELFAMTVADETAAKEAEAAEAAAAGAGTSIIETGGPPLDAAERLELRLERTELERQRAERLRREVEDLQRTLAIERRRLDQERAALEAAQAAFTAERELIAQTEGSEQFQRALETLQGLRPADAKTALQEIIDGTVPIYDARIGLDTSPDAGLRQAVAYLDAMDERQRTKVVAEFVKDEPGLAARLLERLRTRGVVARGPGDDPA